MTAAVCRAIFNNGENIGRFGIRKRGFEYATQYKQNFARYPHAGYGSMCLHIGLRRRVSEDSTAMLISKEVSLRLFIMISQR